jgi:hypothetical protein
LVISQKTLQSLKEQVAKAKKKGIGQKKNGSTSKIIDLTQPKL